MSRLEDVDVVVVGAGHNGLGRHGAAYEVAEALQVTAASRLRGAA